ncbi:MAG TPA: endonuclease III [Rhodospirillales bacterium]|jgi:endonuclease-3|nr:MAG: Endonuclease III [Alphaproteobacteria bacterium MarineAlpha3_Bin6]HHZ75654.1 endonuclease III [Rhodospirillales bacterium]HIM20505.1 endonuclease III [Rhodospirillales bacterium]HIP09219.1 endonuclease III [Rhodospirillales bacterium]
MNKTTTELFYRKLKNENPNPKGELNYINSYTLLVAVVLSAQATDVSVNKATKNLFKIAKTPEQMLDLGEANLKNHIKTIGLYNSKAKNIINLSLMLKTKHRSIIPQDLETLQQLPGVGRKTANVVLNMAFGDPTIAVDTHVFRIANRTGLAEGKTPLEVEKILKRITPNKFKHHAHHWLILHGRYVCKSRKPDCPNCVVREYCNFKAKTTI